MLFLNRNFSASRICYDHHNTESLFLGYCCRAAVDPSKTKGEFRPDRTT